MNNQMQLLGCMLALSVTSPLAVRAAPVSAQPESRHEDLIYKVSCLSKIGRCAFPAFSPDCKTVAFIGEMSGTPQLWTVPIEGGWPTQITNFNDTVIGEEWSPKTNWISLLLQSGGIDRPFYVVSSDGLTVKKMSEGIKYSNTLCGWSPDGKSVLLTSNRVKKETLSPFLADPESGELKPLTARQTDGCLQDITADSHWALVAKWKASSDNDLYRVDTKTGEELLLTPHTGLSTYAAGNLNRSRARISPYRRRSLLSHR